MPAALAGKFAGADEIWHLGDVCTPGILDTLRAVGPPLRFVRGNCDPFEEWPLTLAFELEGFRIHLEHIPPPVAPAGVDLLLHGHTHVPRHQRVGHAIFLNPGCITRANRGAPPSWAWLGLQRGRAVGWELVGLPK
jgi:putative phosphoesterase